MIVYRPDGAAENKDAVDARECVKHCGYTTSPKEEEKQAETSTIVDKVEEVKEEVTVAQVSQVAEEYVPKRGRPPKFGS